MSINYPTVRKFNKKYSVAIDTVPLPEKPADRIELVMKSITPVIDEIVRDAMKVAIGTWPTPDRPKIPFPEKPLKKMIL